MSDSSSSLPESFLDRNLAKIVRAKANTAFAERWIGREVGSYRLESQIGAGAHGVVFRACRTQPYDQIVAIKLFPFLKGIDTHSARFRDECQTLADLDHPHIARILDASLTDDETPYLVMPIIEGIPIDKYVEENKCNLYQVAELGWQLASAVAFAHRKLFVHCDLKPDNILVDENGKAIVTDFGLAVRFDRMQQAEVPSGIPGAIGYAAPEALTSRHSATSAVDVYSFGAVMHKLLTGKPPHQIGGWLDAMIAAVDDHLQPIQTISPEVPTPLANAVDQCLARNPESRPSAGEVESRLEEFVKNGNEPQNRSSNRAVAAGTIAALILASVVLFLVSRPNQGPNRIAAQSAAPAPLPDDDVEVLLQQIDAVLLQPGLKDPAEPGDFEATFDTLKHASSQLEELLSRAPTNRKVRHRTATSYFLLGRAAHWVNEPTYADSSLARSEQMFRDLHRDYPSAGYMFDFFHTLIAQSTRATKRERRDLLLLALGVIEGLNDTPEQNPDYQDALACTCALLADGYVAEDSELFDLEKAEPLAQRALRLATETCESPKSVPLHRKQIMRSHWILSEIARLSGDPQTSLGHTEIAYREAVRLDEAMGIADTSAELFKITISYGRACLSVGKLDAAEERLHEAEPLIERLDELGWPNAAIFQAMVTRLRASIKLARSGTADDRLQHEEVDSPDVKHFGDIWAVHTSKLGSVASGDQGGVVRIWHDQKKSDSPFDSDPIVLECCDGHVWDVEFSPDGTLLAVGGNDETLTLLNADSGDQVWQVSLAGREPDAKVKDVAISPNNKWIAAATGREVVVVNCQSGERVFKLGRRADENVAFGFNGARIYSTHVRENGVWEVLEFDAESRDLLRVLPVGREQIYELSVSPSGMIAAAGYHGNVFLWPTDSIEPKTFATTAKPAWSTAFSPDNKLLAAGCSDGTVRVWNTKTGDIVASLPGHKRWVRTVSFGTGLVVYSGCDEGQLLRTRFAPLPAR